MFNRLSRVLQTVVIHGARFGPLRPSLWCNGYCCEGYMLPFTSLLSPCFHSALRAYGVKMRERRGYTGRVYKSCKLSNQ